MKSIWTITVLFIRKTCAFLTIFVLLLLHKTRNRSCHFIYAINLIQERLVLNDVLKIHSLPILYFVITSEHIRVTRICLKNFYRGA